MPFVKVYENVMLGWKDSDVSLALDKRGLFLQLQLQHLIKTEKKGKNNVFFYDLPLARNLKTSIHHMEPT